MYLPDAVNDVARAVALIDTAPDAGAQAVEWLTTMLQRNAATGQKQLLLRESLFTRKRPSDWLTTAFAALREVTQTPT